MTRNIFRELEYFHGFKQTVQTRIYKIQLKKEGEKERNW